MKKSILISLAAIFLSFLFTSCSKEYSASIPGYKFDQDAKRFLDAAQIVDSVEMKAVNELVMQLKDSGLWSKFSALYPMVGGSATSIKWNLKDPIDQDNAFRLTFSGNPIFSTTGVIFPTKNDFADTHLYDSTMIYNDNSISYYSRTQNSVSGYDMGCIDSELPFNQMAIFHATNATDYFGFMIWGYQPANTIGLFMLTATSGNIIWYENGIQKFQKNDAPVNDYTGYSFLIGNCRNAAAVGQRECAFASIGKGLTDSESKIFSNIIASYQLRLNR